jgi:hypothetical protein
VRIQSTSSQVLQQESAVVIFMTAFIQSAANLSTDTAKVDSLGLSDECKALFKAAVEECLEPLNAFKQAVMKRQIEA